MKDLPRNIVEFLKDANDLQLSIVKNMLSNTPYEQLTENMPLHKEAKFYSRLSNDLRFFDETGNQMLSARYNNKPFGEFLTALESKIKKSFDGLNYSF